MAHDEFNSGVSHGFSMALYAVRDVDKNIEYPKEGFDKTDYVRYNIQKDILYKIDIKAGKLINSKFPMHSQVNHLSDALNDKKHFSKFQEYYDYTSKIRKKCDELKEKVKQMTDAELKNFDVEDKKHWQ